MNKFIFSFTLDLSVTDTITIMLALGFKEVRAVDSHDIVIIIQDAYNDCQEAIMYFKDTTRMFN